MNMQLERPPQSFKNFLESALEIKLSQDSSFGEGLKFFKEGALFTFVITEDLDVIIKHGYHQDIYRNNGIDAKRPNIKGTFRRAPRGADVISVSLQIEASDEWKIIDLFPMAKNLRDDPEEIIEEVVRNKIDRFFARNKK